MTEVEALDFPAPFGTMEAFQTSGGTSTLPESFLGRVAELDYKTIRYPGHCGRFKLLIDLGLCDSNTLDVGGLAVPPRRLMGELLYRHLPADEPDVVLIRLEFVGRLDGEDAADGEPEESGRASRLRYDIIDRFDERTGLSAMQRTTAFPASVVARMMARGETTRKGAVPQERCIPPEAFVRELAARDINIDESFVA